MAKALEFLVGSFSEARVLAIGGLEILRFGMQDLSCQVGAGSCSLRDAGSWRKGTHVFPAVSKAFGLLS